MERLKNHGGLCTATRTTHFRNQKAQHFRYISSRSNGAEKNEDEPTVDWLILLEKGVLPWTVELLRRWAGVIRYASPTGSSQRAIARDRVLHKLKDEWVCSHSHQSPAHSPDDFYCFSRPTRIIGRPYTFHWRSGICTGIIKCYALGKIELFTYFPHSQQSITD